MKERISPTPKKMLKELCTFGIGGPADLYIPVHSIEELQSALLYCKEQSLRYVVIGKGSNTLFDEQGFEGLVIHNKIEYCCEEAPGLFAVGAGYSFSLLGTQTARNGWSGLEFATGIPGSVGGAIFMNAGANGTETCESLKRVLFIDENGELHTFEKESLQFSYRHSIFHEKRGAIAGAEFQLNRSEDARIKQLDILSYRKKTQPYGEKSAGCAFRNPIGESAGKLIEKCGLKGEKSGGAKVSERHANFIINTGTSSSSDVLNLIALITDQVQKKTGIVLENEIRFIPYRACHQLLNQPNSDSFPLGDGSTSGGNIN